MTLTLRRDADSLDALAAAHAELGRFDSAAATAREARSIAEAQGQLHLSRDLQHREALYLRGLPFREQ